MERLIVFGCSMAYGQGLPDCFDPETGVGERHSNLAWPSIISRYMNKECVNKSSPGASNKRIWNEIIKFKFKKDDTVFIMWSYPERTCVLKKDETVDIGPWTDHQYYENIYDDADSILMSQLFVNHANTFLNLKDITVYNLVVEKCYKNILSFNKNTVINIPVYINDVKERHPYALDNAHPGLESHESYSKKILDILGIENNIPKHKEFNLFQRIKQQRGLNIK